jgi:hypothetical protein
VKTKVEAGRSPRLGAGRADSEGLPGDAPLAFETGRETMKLRHLTYLDAVDFGDVVDVH